MRARTIILLWSIAISLGVPACASPPAQQAVEPTAISSTTSVALPSNTVAMNTPTPLIVVDDSPTPATLPTTMRAAASMTASTNGQAMPSSDPHLKPGFPVRTGPSGRTYLNMIVGNINNDPSEEIIVAIDEPGAQYLLALQPDGSLLPNWQGGRGAFAALALGNFSKTSPGSEIVSYFANKVAGQPLRKEWEVGVTIYDGTGDTLPGSPITHPFTGRTGLAPAPVTDQRHPFVVDLDGDGLDEVFAMTHFFRADGSVIPAWDGTLYSPIAGDLDNDGKLEIITTVGGAHPLKAYRADGSPIATFDPELPQGLGEDTAHPVMGDVDGDGSPEIVITAFNIFEMSPTVPRKDVVAIISAAGQVKHIINFTDDPEKEQTLALGDLDCDGAAEIVLQTTTKIFVWKGDGTPFPGWPQDVGLRNTRYSPLIGDVDGDGQPDIVALTMGLYTETKPYELRAYNRGGQLLPGFPKALDYGGVAVPAIADIDNDGRNDIIIAANNASSGNAVWAFDLHGPGPYGAVQWGQFLGGPQHQGNWKSGNYCSR